MQSSKLVANANPHDDNGVCHYLSSWIFEPLFEFFYENGAFAFHYTHASWYDTHANACLTDSTQTFLFLLR